jgi:hypothetical protein
MTDRVLIPLPGVGTLELTRAQYEIALRPFAVPAPSQAPELFSVGVTTGLLDAKGVARALSLPISWIREKARQGAIPCEHAGRYVRFDLAAVRSALTATDHESIGRR